MEEENYGTESAVEQKEDVRPVCNFNAIHRRTSGLLEYEPEYDGWDDFPVVRGNHTVR